jgi:septum formation protein
VRIILASTSKIRQTILANAGLSFASENSHVDEAKIKQDFQHLTPDQLATELARAKSLAISTKIHDSLVIGADQILVFQGTVIGKPKSKSDTENQLRLLRNETHILYSAVSCSKDGNELWSHCSKAILTMRNFTDIFLQQYLSADEDAYMSSVGGYKLETTGIQLFDKINGDYFTILGLPLLPLLAFLRDKKVIPS